MYDISDIKLNWEPLAVAEDQEGIRPEKRGPSKVMVKPCGNVDCITNKVSDEKKHLPRKVWFFDEEDLSYEKVGVLVYKGRWHQIKLQ